MDSKYLLFIFNNFRNNDELVTLIAECITPMVSSKRLKFNYGDDNMVLNFESDLSFDDLKDFISSSITPLCRQYFLINYNDNLSVNMTKDLEEHLFDLENETKTVDMDIRHDIPDKKGIGGNYQDIMNSFPPIISLTGFTFGIDSLISEQKEQKNKIKFDINTILDKIGKSGYESLTDEEKEFLDKNSKT